MRPILFLLLLCAPLCAQTTLNINQVTVANNLVYALVYELDHGATAQSITIDVDANTFDTSGVRVKLLDLDEKVTGGSQDDAEATQPGPGTASVQLVTPSRSGVHPILITIQTAQAGSSTCYGSVTVSAGGITFVDSEQDFQAVQGLSIPFGMYAVFNSTFTTTANFSTNVVMDFGPTPQTPTIRFEGIGTAMIEARLYDVTGGDTLLSTIYATPSGTINTSDFVTTASYSGLVEFRIEVQGDGTAGSIFWATWVPGSVSVVSASGDGVSTPTKGGSKGGGGGCATLDASGTTVAALIVLAATLAVRSRRLRI